MAQREQRRALVDEEELLHGVCLESALEAQVLFLFLWNICKFCKKKSNKTKIIIKFSQKTKSYV